jgi:hypothetical protein
MTDADVTVYPYTFPGNAVVDIHAMFVDWTGDTAGGAAGDIYFIGAMPSAQASGTRLYKLPVANQVNGVSSELIIVAGANTTDVDSVFYSSDYFSRADMTTTGDLIAVGRNFI